MVSRMQHPEGVALSLRVLPHKDYLKLTAWLTSTANGIVLSIHQTLDETVEGFIARALYMASQHFLPRLPSHGRFIVLEERMELVDRVDFNKGCRQVGFIAKCVDPSHPLFKVLNQKHAETWKIYS